MCQQGEAEIAYSMAREKEELYQRYEAFERGEIKLTDDDLQSMAVRMLILRDLGA